MPDSRALRYVFMGARYSMFTPVLALGFLVSFQALAEVETRFRVSQYARELNPSLEISTSFTRESETSKIQALGFLEPGPLGQWGLDAPEFFFRGSTETFAWSLGRVRVLDLSANSTASSAMASPKTAWGSVWVQNQTHPLDPMTSGWISGALQFTLSPEIQLTAALSPVFLPSFGPKLDLSPEAQPTGSRFATLPPQYYDLGGSVLPLHYRITLDDLAQILLQPSFFTSLIWRKKNFAARVAFWTSPSPQPQVTATGGLRVRDSDAFVLVDARPAFPREGFLGGELELTSTWARPKLQLLSSILEPNFWRVSLQLTPTPYLNFGVLHGKRPISGPVVDPEISEGLTWIELGQQMGRWKPSFRWMGHFLRGDHFAEASLGISLTSNSLLKGTAQMLLGPELSYFGTWRSLDSVTVAWEARL